VNYKFLNKSKFAFLTFKNIYVDLRPAAFRLSDGTWAMPGVPVPDLGVWKEWIGSIRVEGLKEANLVLFVEEQSIDERREKLKIRRMIDGTRLEVLHLPADVLEHSIVGKNRPNRPIDRREE
jgi:hypothetical protein